MKMEILDGREKAGGTMLFLVANSTAIAGIMKRNPYIANDLTQEERVEVDKFFLDHSNFVFPFINVTAVPRQKLSAFARRWGRE